MKNPMTVNGEKWIASMSNGTTISEDDEEILAHSGRVSPWGRLMEIINDYNINITQLRVQVLGRTYTCIGKSGRGKYPSPVSPTSYMVYRRIGVDALMPSKVMEHHIAMEADIDGMKYITWIDIYTGDSWLQIK